MKFKKFFFEIAFNRNNLDDRMNLELTDKIKDNLLIFSFLINKSLI